MGRLADSNLILDTFYLVAINTTGKKELVPEKKGLRELLWSRVLVRAMVCRTHAFRRCRIKLFCIPPAFQDPRQKFPASTISPQVAVTASAMFCKTLHSILRQHISRPAKIIVSRLQRLATEGNLRRSFKAAMVWQSTEGAKQIHGGAKSLDTPETSNGQGDAMAASDEGHWTSTAEYAKRRVLESWRASHQGERNRSSEIDELSMSPQWIDCRLGFNWGVETPVGGPPGGMVVWMRRNSPMMFSVLLREV